MTYDEYVQLCAYMNTLCAAYYGDGIEIVPNSTYDLLFRKIEAYEKENPDKVSPISPSKRVGWVKDGVPTVNHIVQMQSIKNSMNYDELGAWMAGIEEKVGRVTYVLEPKYDGQAGDVCYVFTHNDIAVAVQAATRGDGVVGENITRNFLLSPVVREIASACDVNIRGEIMLSNTSLAEINADLPPGDEPYANTRNAISGLMRRKQLNAKLAAKVLFFPYEIAGAAFDGLDRTKKIALLQDWFDQPITSFHCSNKLDEVIATIEALGRELEALDIECDGVVVKVNEAHACDQLGVRSNSPRWATAFKFPPKKAFTIILEFRWQVGRTGSVSPVADVAPVLLGGVMVTKALTHNQDRIQEFDWRVGDTVEVWRGGEVIPRLGNVDFTKRPEDSQPLEFPDTCPCCGTALEKIGPKLYCLNTYGCTDQLKFTYDYIFSRTVFDAEGIADKTIEQIVNKLPVTCSADFFKLTVADILTLDGFAEKSANDIIAALAKARKQPFPRVLQALCIPSVAAQTSIGIANYLIKTDRVIADFFKLTDEEFLSIADVGPATVLAIRQCFNDSKWMENALALIQSLTITYDKPVQVIYRENITGKRIAITGRFPDSRAHMTATLQLHGALVSGNVSGKTDYLIVGEGASTGDVAKATKHKVTILGFEQYKALFNN